MVDFQSRDTRRGLGGRDDEEDVAEDSTDESDAPDAEESGDPTEDDETEADETAADQSDPLTAEEAGATRSTEDDETEADETAADQSEATTAEEDGPATEGTERDSAEGAGDTEQTERSAQRGRASNAGQPAPSGPVGNKSAHPQQGASTRSQSRSSGVDAAVVTIGTAGDEGDPTGEKIVAALERAGHAVTARERLRGDLDGVQQSVDALVGRDDVDVVVTAGGTGIRSDEVAIEAVHPLLEKALPGFGEAFRTLLFEHIGTGIVAVRTTAGIAESTPVFCLPGDQEAAALGVEEIVAAEAGELVAYLRAE
ncbi:molybdopterin-binding protein [Halomicroarcula sp. GCM10025743]|uniref:MogA/MoaB family molybdenum cofactor biosynthesis protein n=1 Tax=Halomicroarcula sp. GCM10025743 TaxID=3252671 RepID=UPI003607AB2C